MALKGLILNEAVTNAIKYVLLGGRTGNVDVMLTAMVDCTYILKVSDDGMEIPGSSEKKVPNTLRMNLMKGLREHLEGEFTIDRTNGISFIFNFRVKRNVQKEIVARWDFCFHLINLTLQPLKTPISALRIFLLG